MTAEIIAVPHYRALRDATGSGVLKNICRRILEDEATHLKYQGSMLARLSAKRNRIVAASRERAAQILSVWDDDRCLDWTSQSV